MRPAEHYPIVPPLGYSPGTLESPEEITVYCACGEWEYFSQASAGGGCDTNCGRGSRLVLRQYRMFRLNQNYLLNIYVLFLDRYHLLDM